MESRKRDCYNLQLLYQNPVGVAVAETLFPLRVAYLLIQRFVLLLERHGFLGNNRRNYYRKDYLYGTFQYSDNHHVEVR